MRKPPTPLKLAIVQSGIRQNELAGEIGVDEAQLSRWANGLHCRDEAIRNRIADVLGVTVEVLWPDLHGAQPDADAAGSDETGRKAA